MPDSTSNWIDLWFRNLSEQAKFLDQRGQGRSSHKWQDAQRRERGIDQLAPRQTVLLVEAAPDTVMVGDIRHHPILLDPTILLQEAASVPGVVAVQVA